MPLINKEWYVEETPEGWCVSFGYPNSEDGVLLQGSNTKENAFELVEIRNLARKKSEIIDRDIS